jgi:hypothetical protein
MDSECPPKVGAAEVPPTTPASFVVAAADGPDEDPPPVQAATLPVRTAMDRYRYK